MFNLANIPKKISNKINDIQYSRDSIGKSDSSVLLFDDMVLKVEKISRSSEHEIKLLNWLDGKFPVPKIIEAETKDGYSFLLMSKLPGEMAATGRSLQNMEQTVFALACGLKKLWEINFSNCPCINNVSEKLIQAKYFIENNLADVNNFEPETLSPDGFSNVSDLYNFLEQNRPEENLVFSHGDFSFENILICGSEITGLLTGVTAAWQTAGRILPRVTVRYGKNIQNTRCTAKKNILNTKNYFLKSWAWSRTKRKHVISIYLMSYFRISQGVVLCSQLHSSKP